MSRFHHPFANTPLLALIGAAFLLRALIPGGWMPTYTVEGFVIQLCSPGSTETDPDQLRAARAVFHAALAGEKQNKDDRKTAGDQPCFFAGLPQLAVPAPASQPLAQRSVPPPPRPAALTASIGRGLPAPRPPSTGPPHVA